MKIKRFWTGHGNRTLKAGGLNKGTGPCRRNVFIPEKAKSSLRNKIKDGGKMRPERAGMSKRPREVRVGRNTPYEEGTKLRHSRCGRS